MSRIRYYNPSELRLARIDATRRPAQKLLLTSSQAPFRFPKDVGVLPRIPRNPVRDIACVDTLYGYAVGYLCVVAVERDEIGNAESAR